MVQCHYQMQCGRVCSALGLTLEMGNEGKERAQPVSLLSPLSRFHHSVVSPCKLQYISLHSSRGHLLSFHGTVSISSWLILSFCLNHQFAFCYYSIFFLGSNVNGIIQYINFVFFFFSISILSSRKTHVFCMYVSFIHNPKQ